MKKLLLFLCLLPLAAFACDERLQMFPEDCAIQDHFHQLRDGFKAIGLDMDQIADYRGLRFIDSNSWRKLTASGESDPHKPYGAATWNHWEQGEEFSHSITAKDLSTKSIAEMHRHVITKELMGLPSRLTGAGPGVYRNKAPLLPRWFLYSCNDGVDKAMLDYLRKGYDLHSPSGAPLFRLGSFEKCDDKIHYHGILWKIVNMEAEKSVQDLLNHLNADLEHPSRSPLALMAYYQRWFVAIHPFGDGNGRTSRLIEDILSRYFDLPYVPAGELQNDVLAYPAEYEQSTVEHVKHSLATLDRCLEENKKGDISPECKHIQELQLPSHLLDALH